MKKNKILKALTLVCCAIILVVASVAGTFAYLTSSISVKNTFTVGNVTISMDEAAVTPYGVVDGTADPARRATNEYKLLPSHTYVKDPTIAVKAGSEECYLFVKVENGIAGIEAASGEDTKTIEDQMIANGWIKLDGVENVWYYAGPQSTNSIVAAGNGEKTIPVFANFTTSTSADVASYADAVVIVTAYAIQADGFNGNVGNAWTAVSSAYAAP
jgi:predicted ribosomally synthesized peptide with SipW-like signal peptide